MRVGELFAGYGGLGMAVKDVWPEAEVAWVSEFDKGPSKVLAHRFPDVPNLGDITKIDWTQVPPVDVITGGSPCQDLSHAGAPSRHDRWHPIEPVGVDERSDRHRATAPSCMGERPWRVFSPSR